MPRFPDTSPAVADIRGSVFTALAAKLRAHRGEVYPFHVGDTWLEPPEGSRMEDLSIVTEPGMHRYSQPEGLPRLVDRLVERARGRTGLKTEPLNILVTTGATGGLGAILGALLEPGEEVLLAAPYWPLIEGIVRAFRGTPIDAPILAARSADEVVASFADRHTDRTVAIYLNTPNNPTGRVLERTWLTALVDWAKSKNLWIVSDEVYEDLVYEGDHVYCRQLAPDHTFSAHSFSKGWAMAGNRCGWVVGPRDRMAELRKVGTHSFYAAPTASQLAACRLLDDPAASGWIARVRTRYHEIGTAAAHRLGVAPPQGGTFLFFDVAGVLDERGLEGFLLDCADRGIFLAPGPSFGPYPTHVRMCFTAAPPDVTERGVAMLAELLARPAG